MFYLHHYFNPDFSHMNLSPHESIDGSVDYRYLGYVQNVVAGQLLAEVIPLEEVSTATRDARFIYAEKHLPCGPNCLPHPNNANKIIAACNGFVFYHQGLIYVKKLLNVRGNVGFHTGHVFFLGDMAVHGDIQTGFSIRANNILVKGHIESAKVKALGDVVCLSGVKGADLNSFAEDAQAAAPKQEGLLPVPSTLIDAGGTVRLPFCEHVQIRSKGNLIIDGACMHSTLYVGGNLVVKGRLHGGYVYCNGTVYIEGQLGSDYNASTKIMMGYDPFDFLMLQKLETQICYLTQKEAYFSKLAARNEVMNLEYTPRLELVQRKLQIAHARRSTLWAKFAVDELSALECRVIVPGKVMPGCEISIGHAFYKTDDYTHDVAFMLEEDEIVVKKSALSSIHKV